MNDIAFKVIIKNDGIDDVIFKTLMLKGEKGDKGDAGGAEIDDNTTASNTTWSSNKISNEIDAKPVNLSELDDVDLDSITDEQLLGYNFTTGKWKNKSVDASTLKYDANTTIKSKIDEKANTADLATVATSGEYNDLSNKPQLATVATSGDYDDLLNKPSIPPAQVNADWNASSGVAEILNKPTIPVVDQTLNTSSSNAIANSAVANGLNGKADSTDLPFVKYQEINVALDGTGEGTLFASNKFVVGIKDIPSDSLYVGYAVYFAGTLTKCKAFSRSALAFTSQGIVSMTRKIGVYYLDNIATQ
ncbi:hypothetical protein [Methanobrevibacter sp.]|uniref:hypothetical protein n=1 Tax=Methanobrevibacter sp. TaxID=66852 RepID=UPI003890B8A8